MKGISSAGFDQSNGSRGFEITTIRIYRTYALSALSNISFNQQNTFYSEQGNTIETNLSSECRMSTFLKDSNAKKVSNFCTSVYDCV